METKKCSKCKAVKSLEEFYNHNTTFDKKTNQCKKCMTEYRQANKERQRLYMENRRTISREETNRVKREWYRKLNPITRMHQAAKSRSKRNNIFFDLDIKDMVMPAQCPLLEIPFIPGTADYYQQTPSLDRIDPLKGYTKDNIMIITKKANSMKNCATKKELLIFSKNILKMFNLDDDIVRSIEKFIESEDKEPQR